MLNYKTVAGVIKINIYSPGYFILPKCYDMDTMFPFVIEIKAQMKAICEVQFILTTEKNVTRKLVFNK